MASVRAASSARRHATPQNRHQPCRKLVIGDAIVGGAVDEEIDFVAREFDCVALLADDVNGTHSLESSARLAFRWKGVNEGGGGRFCRAFLQGVSASRGYSILGAGSRAGGGVGSQ